MGLGGRTHTAFKVSWLEWFEIRDFMIWLNNSIMCIYGTILNYFNSPPTLGHDLRGKKKLYKSLLSSIRSSYENLQFYILWQPWLLIQVEPAGQVNKPNQCLIAWHIDSMMGFTHCHVMQWNQEKSGKRAKNLLILRIYENLKSKIRPFSHAILKILQNFEKDLNYFQYSIKKTKRL